MTTTTPVLGQERDFPERYQLLGIDPRTHPLDVATASVWITKHLLDEVDMKMMLEEGIVEVWRCCCCFC